MEPVTFEDMTTEEQLLWLCRTMNQLLTEFEPILERARRKGKRTVPMFTQKGIVTQNG